MLEDARPHWGKQHVALQTDISSCGWQHEACSALLAGFFTPVSILGMSALKFLLLRRLHTLQTIWQSTWRVP